MRLGPAAQGAIPALRISEFSDYAIVRVYATAALLRLGDADTPLTHLLDAWRDTYDPEDAYPLALHWLEAVELLGPLGVKAVPQLIALLAEPRDQYEEDYRWQSARVLAKIGPESKLALPRLKEMAFGTTPLAEFAAEAARAIERK